MSRYLGVDLFGSGPHRFTARGVTLRHASHHQPGADGVVVTPLGRTSTKIEQQGTLLADTVASLEEQMQAIEATVGRQPGLLIDQWGRRWERMMLLSFHPGPIRRVGRRLAVEYEAEYVEG